MNSIVLDKFRAGTITNPDIEDVPIEASVFATNIDGSDEDGKLKGIYAKGTAMSVSGGDGADIRLADWIYNASKWDLIYHDANENKIIAIKDFYGTPTEEDLISSLPTDNVSIIANNREAHIGLGGVLNGITQWAGYIDFAQFNEFTDLYFAGGGLNDATKGGTYTGNGIDVFAIEIDATGTPDTFKWQKNGGSYTTGVSITGAAQSLADGITVTFGATTGHTLGDIWYIVYTSDGVTGIQTETAECDEPTNEGFSIASASETTGSAPKPFLSTDTYQWGLSLRYDGFQESPISWGISDTPSADSEYYSIQINRNNFMLTGYSISKRIDAIHLWRREKTAASGLYGVARLVNVYDTSAAEIGEGILLDRTWSRTSANIYITIRDYGYVGSSYERYTGIDETINNTMINYSLSCKGGGFLFAGNCYHTTLGSLPNVIIKSKSKRYDMFDYINDLVRIDETPVAMAYYNERLFAFGLNTTYIINPNTMSIEGKFIGTGASGQRSVCVTPFGLFVANKNSAWMYDGTFQEISNRIKVGSYTSGFSWRTFSFASIPEIIVTYDAVKGYVLFSNDFDASPDQLRSWAYHIEKDRWDLFYYESNATANHVTANSGLFTGKDGETYFSNSTGCYKLFAGASTLAWAYYSRLFTGDNPSQDKMWYHILPTYDGSGTIIITFGIEREAYNTTGVTNSTEIKTSGDFTYAKSLGFLFSVASGGTVEVSNIEILYRPLIGMRKYG